MFLALALILSSAPSAGPAPQCSGPERHEFDFWIGDWDSFDVHGDAGAKARAHVRGILGGCALEEVYEGHDGLVGESLTAYDPARKVWHQTWASNGGEFVTIEGRRDGDRLVLEGSRAEPEGGTVRVRGTWKREGTTVHEWAETSQDQGASWVPWFDIVFRPHHP